MAYVETSNERGPQCEGPQGQYPLSPCIQTLCALMVAAGALALHIHRGDSLEM